MSFVKIFFFSHLLYWNAPNKTKHTPPHHPHHSKELSVMDIRRRYNNLYVPSDFFSARLCWAEVLPLHRPLKLGSRACSFHVRRRNVNDLPPVHDNSETCSTPSDASHLYSAKVYIASPQPHPHSPNPIPTLRTPSPLSQPRLQPCPPLSQLQSQLFQPHPIFPNPDLPSHPQPFTNTASPQPKLPAFPTI